MRTFLSLFAAALFAQEPAPLAIKVDVSLVNVAFIVRDQSGALAGNLTKDDIEVLEDGVPQEVRFFGRSADLPLRLALVMDVSGSQEKFNKQHKRDVQKFVSTAVEPRDRALLICFGDHIRLVSDFTASPRQLIDSMSEFPKGSGRFPELDPDNTRDAGTALFDSIYAVTRKLGAPARERRALIVFSDGEDNSSAHDLMDAIEAAQIADSPIYTVRYTEVNKGRLTSRDRYGIREMDRLAKETGAASFDASRDDVAKSLRSVAEELRSMYDVGYVSTNAVHDGSFRKVEIRAKKPGLTVRAKPGYYGR
jgi:Ca-activated chloride channel family protein